MFHLRAVILAFAATLACGGAAMADDVRIKRRDGTTVEGLLKSFEDGVYVITTPAGDVPVEVGGVATIDIGGVPKPVPQGQGAGAGKARPDAMEGRVSITTAANRTIVGRIVSFEDGIYEIETVDGVQRVGVGEVARIEALKPAPPVASGAIGEPRVPIVLTGEALTLSGSRSLGEVGVRQLLESYALLGGAVSPVWSQRSARERMFEAQIPDGKTFSAALMLKGTAGGIDDLIAGTAQIAMLERRLTVTEGQRVSAAGLGDPFADDNEAIIGPSAVVIIVHPSNPVKALTFAQVSGIFSGRIRNWSEVGGANRRIQVLAPMPGSTLIDVTKAGLGEAFDISAAARRVGSSLETADLVGADPAAIGLSHTESRGNTTALALTNSCGRTFDPSDFQIESETYPLWSRLMLYTTNKAPRQARDFLTFAQSATAQRILRERGHGSLMPAISAKGPLKLDGTEAARYADASSRFVDVAAAFVDSASRLSVTFRFESGGDRLDARGIADAGRLVEFVKAGGLGQRTIALVGYSESTGQFAADVAQSKARAIAVSEVLQKKGLNVERLFGFGPLLPVECERMPASAQRNRRVEVWVE